MIDSSNKISGSGAPQQPDPAGFRAFTGKIMELVAGLNRTLFPSGDASLTKPDELLRGNPQEPDSKKADGAKSGGSTSVRTESSSEDKRELLRELRREGDSDDVGEINPRMSDLDDDDVIKFIEEGKYADALDLIRDNREDEAEETKDDGKPADGGDVSKAKDAGDANAEDKAPEIGDDKAGDAAKEPSDEG